MFNALPLITEVLNSIKETNIIAIEYFLNIFILLSLQFLSPPLFILYDVKGYIFNRKLLQKIVYQLSI